MREKAIKEVLKLEIGKQKMKAFYEEKEKYQQSHFLRILTDV
jgi:hypothetical protein